MKRKSKFDCFNHILLLHVCYFMTLCGVCCLINLICSYNTNPFLATFLNIFSLIVITIFAIKLREKIANKYVYKALLEDLDPSAFRENLDPRNILSFPRFDWSGAELYSGNYQIALNILESLLREKRPFAMKYRYFVRKLHVYHCLQDIENLKNTYKELDSILQNKSERTKREYITPTIRYFEKFIDEDYASCVTICQNELATWEEKGAPSKLTSIVVTYRLAVALFMQQDYATAEKYFASIANAAPKLDYAKRATLYIEAIHAGKDSIPPIVLIADPNYQVYNKKDKLTLAFMLILFQCFFFCFIFAILFLVGLVSLF